MPLVDQVLGQIEARVREAGQAPRLRISAEDVRCWAEVGERCKRIKFYWEELEKEEAAL